MSIRQLEIPEPGHTIQMETDWHGYLKVLKALGDRCASLSTAGGWKSCPHLKNTKVSQDSWEYDASIPDNIHPPIWRSRLRSLEAC